MNIWYEITPIDTLFFRGSEPMEAGQLASTPLFPPPISVISGTVRTAVLRERGISFSDYKNKPMPDDLIYAIGACGEPAPFSVCAILMKRGEEIYVPAPATWFVDSDVKFDSSDDYTGNKVVTANSDPAALTALGVITSSGTFPLVVARHEARSLAGCWIRIDLLSRREITFAKGDLLTNGDLYAVENRIGIGIDAKRKVEKGKLYSANHIRLREGVTILIGIDRDPGLSLSGLFQLGGEQRRSHHEKCSHLPDIPKISSPAGYLAMAPVEATAEMLGKVIAAPKPVITAGWDLSRGFHKPSTTWFPAGSVFSEPITNACAPIAL